ncbi:MAG TPA: murein L,D-transpeptidase catalytic domain family protein [Vicinamibacterales bacterium]
MLPKCAVGTRALFVRVTLIIVALALLPLGTHAWGPPSGGPTIRLKPDPTGHATTGHATTGHATNYQADLWSSSSLGTIDTNVFNLALGAANCAVRSGAVTNPSTLTVIDYSKPSTRKRLWVFDLRSHELVYEELVAHGQGSGGNVPTLFSNEPETHRTSLGLFVTEGTYIGKNGYSLRLDGLDRGWNDRARERAIVMHGAPYVSEQFAQAQGRLGRSWGCPALREGVARAVIDRVKGGGLVFAYYPDQDWLNASRYLGGCNSN